MVHPPRTASGSVARMAPSTGKNPAKIMIIAPAAIAKRLTTFVIATRPTFWLNDVIGRHPNSDEIELTKPSQAIEPEVSLVDAFLSKADDARALVSPIVSVAETRKIRVTEIIAFQLKSNAVMHRKFHCHCHHQMMMHQRKAMKNQ